MVDDDDAMLAEFDRLLTVIDAPTGAISVDEALADIQILCRFIDENGKRLLTLARVGHQTQDEAKGILS
jgi:hypothetical protein